MEIVDAKGKLCPVPLVMTKKVFDALQENEQMQTIIDNDTSAKNVETFVVESGGDVVSQKDGKITTLTITKGQQKLSGDAEAYCELPNTSLPHVIYIARDKVGNGEPKELGDALMLAFLKTIKDVTPLPSHVILIHNGVTLLKNGSKTAEALLEIEQLGIRVIACGACLDYLNLMDSIACGKVSNMYDILTIQSNASKVVCP